MAAQPLGSISGCSERGRGTYYIRDKNSSINVHTVFWEAFFVVCVSLNKLGMQRGQRTKKVYKQGVKENKVLDGRDQTLTICIRYRKDVWMHFNKWMRCSFSSGFERVNQLCYLECGLPYRHLLALLFTGVKNRMKCLIDGRSDQVRWQWTVFSDDVHECSCIIWNGEHMLCIIYNQQPETL